MVASITPAKESTPCAPPQKRSSSPAKLIIMSYDDTKLGSLSTAKQTPIVLRLHSWDGPAPKEDEKTSVLSEDFDDLSLQNDDHSEDDDSATQPTENIQKQSHVDEEPVSSTISDVRGIHHSILLPPSFPPPIHTKGPWKRLPKPDIELIRRKQDNNNSYRMRKESSTTKLRVSFGGIQVRNYRQIIGDNPAVSCGPPIQLDWEYEVQASVPLDTYEATKTYRRTNPRQFLLNYYQRRTILSYCCGYSDDDIHQAEVQTDKVRRQRNMTKTMAPMMVVEDFVGSAARKTKRLIRRRR